VIILDTNVISEFGRDVPKPIVVDWLAGRTYSELATCAPVYTELWYGAQKTKLGSGSERYFKSMRHMVENVIDHRILPFDLEAASTCGNLRAAREAKGRPIYILDAMIAAICIVNGAALATRNARDFDGLDLKVINPFEPA